MMNATDNGTICNAENARRIGTKNTRFGRIVPTTGGWRVSFNSKAPHNLCVLGVVSYHTTLEEAVATYKARIRDGI